MKTKVMTPPLTRIENKSAFKIFSDIAESFEIPSQFNHEPIFTWDAERVKDYLTDLLFEMSEEEMEECLKRLNPDEYDFALILRLYRPRRIPVLPDSGRFTEDFMFSELIESGAELLGIED